MPSAAMQYVVVIIYSQIYKVSFALHTYRLWYLFKKLLMCKAINVDFMM